MSDEQNPTLTFDGVEYLISDLSDEARVQLQNLQQAELELQRLQVQQAMIGTARNAYNQALVAALPKPAKAAKPKKVAKPVKKKKAKASA